MGQAVPISREEAWAQTESNYEAFERMLPDLLEEHAGEWALLRDRAIVEFFVSWREALVFARGRFPDERFSIQQVAEPSRGSELLSSGLVHFAV